VALEFPKALTAERVSGGITMRLVLAFVPLIFAAFEALSVGGWIYRLHYVLSRNTSFFVQGKTHYRNNYGK
jgi:hypothetical protein